MSVFIVTEAMDMHADAVSWALEQLGCECWIPSDAHPWLANARIGNSNSNPVTLNVNGAGHSLNQFRSIWLRRQPKKHIPEELQPEDRAFVARESDYFFRGLDALIDGAELVANEATAVLRANLKGPQLRAAKALGLNIPETLLSNDLAETRAFIEAAPGKVIYKTYTPASWKSGEEMFSLPTTILRLEDLEDIDQDYFNPGIFQWYVEKHYELRISIFGETCIAARIDGQDSIDWRKSYNVMQVTPYALPDWLEDKLLAFMKKMNLVMGMVDMIVTPQGEYVFLEVNQQGQFLWVEMMNPSIKMLEPFSLFLASADPKYKWSSKTRPRASLDYQEYQRSSNYIKFVEHYKTINEKGALPNPWMIVEDRSHAHG